MPKAVLMGAVALGALMAAGQVQAKTQQSAGPIVQTAYGAVQGVTVSGINDFLGIPYAAPPVGNLRWAAPVPPAPWATTRQATSYSAYCPQGFSEIGGGGGAEDCLYLNVQTPASATASSKLPVMVWIHGGGLTTGSGQEYDGTGLINSGNVVYVSFNYRLGLLGFLALPALASADPHGSSGNYGLLDQQAAIAWVRQNIAAFGGDPSKITIFGESAGGQSTIDQLVSPLLGKVSAAVIESGAYARSYPTQAQGQTAGQAVAASLNCASTNLACLRAVPAATLVTLADNSSTIAITPNVDGYVLPQQPFQAFAAGHFPHVPIIDGTNHDEYRLFVSEDEILAGSAWSAAEYYGLIQGTAGSYAAQVEAEYPLNAYINPGYATAALATDYAFSCGALVLDALISQYTTLYTYELTDPNVPNVFLPFDPNMPSLGDSHAAELPYLFPAFKNTYLNLGPANFSAGQLNLAAGMRASWTSLARYGRPLNPRGGAWLPYNVASHNFLALAAPSPTTEYGFYSFHNCGFWGPYLLTEAGLPANTQY
jgi:para-nitrobenzyl esterase